MPEVEVVDEEQGLFLSPIRSEHVGKISRTLCSMDPWHTMDYSPGVFEFYLLRADTALTRCEITISGNSAGVLALRAPWLSGPFLELLAIFDGFRGQGVGFKLIDWICARYCKSANLWATVASFNVRAQKFYRKAGFRQIAILDDLVKKDWDEVLIRKRITADR